MIHVGDVDRAVAIDGDALVGLAVPLGGRAAMGPRMLAPPSSDRQSTCC